MLPIAIACAIGALASSPSIADVPTDRKVAILARSLGYERTLAKRAGPELDIIVVARGGSTASAGDAHALEAALAPLGGVTVQGMPIRVSVISTDDTTVIDALAQARKADVLLIAADAGPLEGALVVAARRLGVLTASLSGAAATRGVMLAVTELEGKPKVVVNLGEARAARIEFASDLLKVAQVIR